MPMLGLVQTILNSAGLAAAIVSLPAYLPFGVPAQTRPSELGCEALAGGITDHSGQYSCMRLPRSDPMFEQYILAYVDGVGLCNVVAVSPYIKDDARGSTTRHLFDRAARSMQKELGPPSESIDHSHTPLVAEDGHFREGVINQDRQVFDQWTGLSQRFSNLDSVSLTVSGDPDWGLAVYGIYRFSNNDACMREMEVVTGPDGE
jgi:hypothetical protein